MLGEQCQSQGQRVLSSALLPGVRLPAVLACPALPRQLSLHFVDKPTPEVWAGVAGAPDMSGSPRCELAMRQEW